MEESNIYINIFILRSKTFFGGLNKKNLGAGSKFSSKFFVSFFCPFNIFFEGSKRIFVEGFQFIYSFSNRPSGNDSEFFLFFSKIKKKSCLEIQCCWRPGYLKNFSGCVWKRQSQGQTKQEEKIWCYKY